MFQIQELEYIVMRDAVKASLWPWPIFDDDAYRLDIGRALPPHPAPSQAVVK